MTDWYAGAGDDSAALRETGVVAPPGGGDSSDDGRWPSAARVLLDLRVEPAPESVPAARRAIGSSLSCDSGPQRDLVGDVKLVAGELLTNAILHGQPPVDLRLLAARGALRVEVADASKVAPELAFSSIDAMTGRGLALVDELAADWGTNLRPDGKVVWAEVAVSAESEPQAACAPLDAPAAGLSLGAAGTPGDGDATLPPHRPAPRSPGREARYGVDLGEVSTDLLLAAKAHVDNLAREFALAAAGASNEDGPAVPQWLAELVDRVTTRFAEVRQAIRRLALAADAAGERRTRLELTLPESAADAGEEYLAALDEADHYAREARLLTLESPPLHWAFRRWYVTAIAAQLRAAAQGLPAPDPGRFEDFRPPPRPAGDDTRERRT